MDSIDRDILMHLQSDARLSMTALGKLIGLSQPAITERVKRLEEQGVIKATGLKYRMKSRKIHCCFYPFPDYKVQ